MRHQSSPASQIGDVVDTAGEHQWIDRCRVEGEVEEPATLLIMAGDRAGGLHQGKVSQFHVSRIAELGLGGNNLRLPIKASAYFAERIDTDRPRISADLSWSTAEFATGGAPRDRG